MQRGGPLVYNVLFSRSFFIHSIISQGLRVRTATWRLATNFDIWALGRPVLPLNILPFRLSTAITGAQSSLAARG